MQLRAAAHAAAQVAAESDAEEADLQTLRSEKPDSWSSLVPSPEKEAIREELVNESGSDGFCEEAEKPSLKERFKDSIPEFEEIQEIEAIMGETNQCCLCDFKCPVEKQKKGRLFGVLETLWELILRNTILWRTVGLLEALFSMQYAKH